MKTSRLPGFYKLSIDARIAKLAETYALSVDEVEALASQGALELAQADKMVENAVGIYSLPIGLGLNFQINGKDYLVPMAIEEPSVVASASHIAKIVREAGGFEATTTGRTMIGQVQVVGCPDWGAAAEAVIDAEEELVAMANACHPAMVERGGGARGVEVRLLNDDEGSRYAQMLVVHLLVDTCDAMGANTVNTMVEALAERIEALTEGKVYLRILSNYTDQCLATATCRIPPALLATGEFDGEAVRDGVVSAHAFADSDVYRAVTHNKGVMNGIDAVVIATGNDWRAIEAAAHAHASRHGRYGSMTEWSTDAEGHLVGRLELPMPVGTVGGSIGLHPMAQIMHKFLRVKGAEELAQVIVCVGLAQNLGALKALVTHGIQKGHMALHARSVAMTAGATGDQVDAIARAMVDAREIKLSKAKSLLEAFQ
ncbi:MAG: hydroxymethylglutaryl-CoA reductase, degradative [Candidatus Sericytochromatia bacterium]|nr:hydroxymethylglutaryl-CoA reductase, degradative [Candidatus Sericytochromatia bacterium]